MKCPVSGTSHDLVMPNIEIVYRDTCDETITSPVITEISGTDGQCNKRIVTIPCNGCEKCQKVKAYGCRIKTCNLEDGRNTKSRATALLDLVENCTDLINVVNGSLFTDITDFESTICTQLDTIGITGLFGSVIISGPLPAFEEPFIVASVQDGACTEAGIETFTAGEYRLENCGGTALFTIQNSSMP